MHNVIRIAKEVTGFLRKYTPFAVAAEQAFLEGGWGGLVGYLEKLAQGPPQDGGPAPAEVAALVARLRAGAPAA